MEQSCKSVSLALLSSWLELAHAYACRVTVFLSAVIFRSRQSDNVQAQV